jgi:hypothetical protein
LFRSRLEQDSSSTGIICNGTHDDFEGTGRRGY